MKAYFEVHISAESQADADNIIDLLLEKRLVTGGQFITSPARFLWKGIVTDMNYITITSFTTSLHLDRIIESVKDQSVEEVPMVRFFEINQLNDELRSWIDETVL